MMYHFARAVAGLGINVIIDGMLEEREGFMEYHNKTNYDIMLDVFADYNMFMVEVYCPLDECRHRNIERGDRGENQSQEQHDIMNKNIKYDFFVDTSIYSAEECAGKILKELRA
jgi:adenylylsulfate kinase/chloramphenicol 3-O phosphotransferase